jgi:hypothetical protein
MLISFYTLVWKNKRIIHSWKLYTKLTITKKKIFFTLLEYSYAIFLRKFYILDLYIIIHKIIEKLSYKALISFKKNGIIR